MIRAGSAAVSSSNNNSSIRVAFFENTLKLTPPGTMEAPSGAIEPVSMTPCAHGVDDTQGHDELCAGVIGVMSQTSRQYSRIDRSDEKRPTRALLRIDIRVQLF